MQPHKKRIHPRTLVKMVKQKRKFSAARLKKLIKEKRFMVDASFVVINKKKKERHVSMVSELGVLTTTKFNEKGKIVE